MQENQHIRKMQQRAAFLSRYQEIYPDTPEWSRIQYQIQMAFSNVSISLRKIYVIMNSSIQNKFISANQSKNMLDFIVPENTFSNDEDFLSVCQKGFQKPLILNYGHIDLDKIGKETQQIFEIMVCRAAVGSTYIFPTKSANQSIPFKEKPQLMTRQFDSLFLYDESINTRQFRQQYIVYESNIKILPMYVLNFAIEPNKYKELKEKVICQLCQDNVAQKYCETQQSYFCIDCDFKHHHNRLSFKHKRTQITQKPKSLSECSQHPKLTLQLFCLQCNRPICINCKIKGDHSSGQFLTHVLVRISERYEETMLLMREADSNLQKKKKSLSISIQSVQERLKEINRKSQQIQDKIYQIMQNALKDLENITKKKMALLMSDHIELKRQMDFIQWMQKFLKYQFEVLSPNDFLLAWSRHCFLRKEVLGNDFTVGNVQPDIRVQGYMKVLTQEQLKISLDGNANIQDNIDIGDVGKSSTLKKAQQKNQNTLKIKIPIEREKGASQGKSGGVVRSFNNLLNLSVLKHIER